MLIFYQNVLDLFGCLFLAITYAVKLGNIYLTGLGRYWLCMLLLNESFLWCTIDASKTNLMVVTVERYLKVVHSIWSKKKLRKWMIYSAMAVVLISAAVHEFGLLFATSVVVDGACYPYAVWESRVSQIAYSIWHFLSFYVIELAVFALCYWRILVVVRRQARVMASHSAADLSNASALSHHQIQTSVIKTMILVSALFAVSDLPMHVYALLWIIDTNLTLLDGGYYASVFLSFLYICANPFVYATKFDPVKNVLLGLIPCTKAPVQVIESVEMPGPRTSAKRPGHSHK